MSIVEEDICCGRGFSKGGNARAFSQHLSCLTFDRYRETLLFYSQQDGTRLGRDHPDERKSSLLWIATIAALRDGIGRRMFSGRWSGSYFGGPLYLIIKQDGKTLSGKWRAHRRSTGVRTDRGASSKATDRPSKWDRSSLT